MKFTPLSICDVILVEPQVFGDERGFFMETFRSAQFADHGISLPFVQDNHSGSRQSTLRGLHYQVEHIQGKLVRVISGDIFDVVVDIRRSSPTFGKWVSCILSSANHLQLWVPPGFAHGFLVTSEWAEVVYKTTDYYDPNSERTLLWNDPTLGIDWPLQVNLPTLSNKDTKGIPLQDCETFNF
jgi:dTDP-4-dehydrorhamnose 3,5-epimerase